MYLEIKILKFHTNKMIPRNIHQIWLQGYKHLPEKYKIKAEKIKSFHEGWNYKLWSEKDILDLLDTEEEVKTYYNLQYLHQKVDYARYIILYKIGGVYIDIDVDILKPLDGLLEMSKDYDLTVSKLNVSSPESYFVCMKQECINNGIIFSKPKNNVLYELIRHIDKKHTCNFLDTKITCINNTTGPNIFSDIVMKHKNVLILEPEYVEPCFQGTCKITRNTFLIHQQDGTWFGGLFKSIIRFYFGNRLLCITGILLLFLFFIILVYRKYYK